MADIDLASLVLPAHTAVVTMELQRGVVGDLAALPELRESAESVAMPRNAGRLCVAARAAGATVVHCTAEFRSDGRGSTHNARILAASAKLSGNRLNAGEPGTELIPELRQQPSDIVVARSHGLTPFVSTGLDQILRNCGVETVIAVGNSLNIGVLGLVLNAVDLGYRVVVPRDAVVGVPVAYGATVLDGTVSLLATVVDTDQLVAGWG